MYKQVMKKTCSILSVLGVVTAAFISTHANEASAQHGYLYCYVYCTGDCEATGYCILQDGSPGPIMTGYMGECCYQ